MAIDPRKRNRIIVYSAIGLSVAAVLGLLIAGGILLFGDNKKPTTTTTVTPSPKPSYAVSPTPDHTSIPVNNDAKLTMKLEGSGSTPGSLWQIDPSTLLRTALASQASVITVYSWSPDNKYLAIVANNSANIAVFSVFSAADNKLLFSNLKLIPQPQVFWQDNSNIVVLDGTNKSTPQMFSITIPTMEVKVLSIGTKQAADHILANQNLSAFILLDLNKPFLFNASDSSLHDLITEGVLSGSEFNTGNWIDNQRFIYYTIDGLFVLDANSRTTRQLLTLRSTDKDPYNSTGFMLSANKENLYFIFTGKLFRYNFETRINQEMFDINSTTDLGGDVSYSILPNELGAVISGTNKSYLIEFATKKLDQLCETVCQQAVVQN